ncbi:hypothetical protein ES703_104318 [subsurface metagenome]
MENEASKNTRPTFLTVVCIISFIGLGMSVISNLVNMAFGTFSSAIYPLVQSGFEEALSNVEATDPAASVLVEQIFNSILKLFEVMPLLAGISLICALIALTGVILMWKLKKTGFYLYTVAKVILIFVPMILIGVNIISTIAAISGFFVAAIFITLYALNLKAMK